MFGRIPVRSRIGVPSIVLIAAMAPCAYAQAAPHVPVVAPQFTHYRTTIEVSGQIAAVKSATLAAQRAGVVSEVRFHSGARVAKGAVLLRMDDAVERAQVTLDRAKLDEAGRTVARDRKLRTISGVSEAQLETDQAAFAEAQAQLALDTARANRRVIRAPFAGVLGIRRVSAGDYVALGATITTITQIRPLRVLFAVPETELDGIAPGDAFRFAMPVGGGVEHDGRIVALSPALNPKTRARMVEGRIANASGVLLPGAFGVVHIATGTPVAALGFPATAIDYGPLGSFVYAVDRKGKASIVHAVYVHVLSTHGAVAMVAAKGLPALDAVVAIGGFKLHDGAAITPVEPAAPVQASRAAKPSRAAKSGRVAEPGGKS